MHFVRLINANADMFAPAFQLYTASFPLHEQRSLDKQRLMLANPRYHFCAMMQDDVFAGIMLFWEFAAYGYIEHFAVSEQLRGQALGSEILRLFCAAHRLTILEIDPPVDAVSQRREKFYTKLDFQKNAYPHAHPAYSHGAAPHPLLVMSHPRSLTTKEYSCFAADLAHTVMGDIQASCR